MKLSSEITNFLESKGWRSSKKKDISSLLEFLKERGYEVSPEQIEFLELFDGYSFEFPVDYLKDYDPKATDLVSFNCEKNIRREGEVPEIYEETVGEKLLLIGENSSYFLIMLTPSGKMYAAMDNVLYFIGNNIGEALTNYYHGPTIVRIPLKIEPCTFTNNIYKIKEEELEDYINRFSDAYKIEVDGKNAKIDNLYEKRLEKIDPNNTTEIEKLDDEFIQYYRNYNKILFRGDKIYYLSNEKKNV